ncbi:MAG: hypothetical protein ACSLEM_01890 [Candidatus Malihini olakiniferum]
MIRAVSGLGKLVGELLNKSHLEGTIWSDSWLIQTELNLVIAEMLRDT